MASNFFKCQMFFKDLFIEHLESPKVDNSFLSPFGIDLQNYDLKDEDLARLTKLILQTTNFTKLSIKLSDTISSSPNELIKLLRKISIRKQFTSLDFYIKNLNEENLKVFIEFLEKINNALLSFKLSVNYDDKIEEENIISRMLDSLNKNQFLKDLENLIFVDVNLSNENILQKLKQIINKFNKLKTFTIGNKNLINLNDFNIQNIEVVNIINTNLKMINKLPKNELNLSENNLSLRGIQLLSDLIKGKEVTLKVLDLEKNYIGDDGCEILSEGLKYNNSIETLNLRENNIINRGLVAIANAIKSDGESLNNEQIITTSEDNNNNLCYKKLNKLNLSYNYIDSQGLEAFCEILKNEPEGRFIKLDFSSNQIDNNGLLILSKFYIKQYKIEDLILNIRNGVSDTIQEALTQDFTHLNNLKFFYSYSLELNTSSLDCFNMMLLNNKNLESFFITNNKALKDEGLIQICPGIENNNKLTRLYLNQCLISDSGAEALAKALFKNMSISELDLDQNKIGEKGTKAIAEKILRKDCLKKLNLGHNLLNSKCGVYIGQSLIDAQGIENLILKSNKLGNEGCEMLSKGIEINHTLTSLNLENNQINDEGIKYIAKVLKNKPKFQSLNLSTNLITEIDEDFYSLFNWLETITISDNPLCQSGIARLFQGSENNRLLTKLRFKLVNDNYDFHFKCYNENIRELDLFYNNFNISLMKHVATLKNLNYLSLQSNNIKDKDILKLCQYITENKTPLKHLLLQGNEITENGITGLSKLLTNNTTLKELNIANNPIKNKGLISICNTLKNQNNYLQILYINSIKINDYVALEIYNLLKDNKTLTLLNISGNPFTNVGIDLILSSLRVNKTLTKLFLGEHRVNEDAFKNLPNYLLFNNSLMQLEIRNCQLKDYFIINLGKSLRNNNSLKYISLSSNDIGIKGALNFCQNVSKNDQLCEVSLLLNRVDRIDEKIIVSANRHMCFYTIKGK